jgi:HEPN domain-containing protein
MAEPPDAVTGAGAWVEKAEHDLAAAAHLLGLGDACPFDVVCFHAHQTVEKYLKALLVERSVDFPRTHDLVVLARQAGTVAPAVLDPADLLSLNRYSTEARYPGEWDPITRADAEQALAAARRIRLAIRERLPKDAAR